MDALTPIVPAETVVITAGASAAGGAPNAPRVVLAAVAGAMLGDLLAHQTGRGAGPLVQRLRRRPGTTRLLERAEQGMCERGGQLLVAARFVPGGRTATTPVSGAVRFPRGRFVLCTGIAALACAVYGVGIGMVGGTAVRDQPLLGVALAVGLALAGGLALEGIRTLRAGRSA